MKKKEEILDDEFTRKWGNSFFGCAEGYTGEQFAQTAYPLIQKSMQTYADKSCAAKDAEIAELKRRVAELEVELSESMEIKITRLIAEKGKYEMNLEHPMLIAFIGCLIDCYRVFGGKNYLSIRCVYENELYECVIARIEGKTPAELVDELKIELAEAKRRIADLESHLSSYVNTTNPIIPR